MREKFNHLDSHERKLLIHSLVELKKFNLFSKADIRIVLTSLFLRS
mgnify:CR=1 FL=1